MFRLVNKITRSTTRAGQAAIELAIFGAILIFILGTIVRTAMSNGYAQNQNFKAMRMAMLQSWQGSKAHPGPGPQNTAYNSASVLFVEDRLSPDFNKYGDLDRNPFVAQGSGTFSYNLLYPWQPGVDTISNLLPIMDVYINGQHFPLTTANFVQSRRLTVPACSGAPAQDPLVAQEQCVASGNTPQQCEGAAQAQCLQNQCLRNAREWAGGVVNEGMFLAIVPVAPSLVDTTGAANAIVIFNQLYVQGLITNLSGTTHLSPPTENVGYTANVTTVGSSGPLPALFVSWLQTTYFSGATTAQFQAAVNSIQSILQSNHAQYKLFYEIVANDLGASVSSGSAQFSPNPPACSSPSSSSCVNKALSANLVTKDAQGTLGTWNSGGDMQYDLMRFGDYSATTGVESKFGAPVTSCASIIQANSLRCYIAWQWGASAAISPSSIGLDTSSNQYPSYDIDGRLKQVTVYGLSQNSDGTPSVSYEDFQGGDIDGTWDFNSCTPKPGLQSASEIYTFTKNGTYLQIKEGKLFNPETDQFVRSVNQRDNVDMIQREIQLSNNTGRFCPINVINGVNYMSDGITPNPVELCVDGTSQNCFSSQTNIKSTCYDTSDNIIFVRSRLQDRRGTYWLTDTTGKMNIK